MLEPGSAVTGAPALPLTRRPNQVHEFAPRGRKRRTWLKSKPGSDQGLVDLTARKIGGSASPGSSTRVIVKPLLMIVLKKPASGTWLMPT